MKNTFLNNLFIAFGTFSLYKRYNQENNLNFDLKKGSIQDDFNKAIKMATNALDMAKKSAGSNSELLKKEFRANLAKEEKQQKIRNEEEIKNIIKETNCLFIYQVAAFIISVLFIVVGCELVIKNHEVIGITVAIAPLGLIICSKMMLNKEVDNELKAN